MTLFQNSVLRNHLQHIDTRKVDEVYRIYTEAFLPKIANIRTSKEKDHPLLDTTRRMGSLLQRLQNRVDNPATTD